VTDKPEGKFHTGAPEKIYDVSHTLALAHPMFVLLKYLQYKDNVIADIEGIDAKQPHRNVDLQ
jgi:hypothetical protein